MKTYAVKLTVICADGTPETLQYTSISHSAMDVAIAAFDRHPTMAAISVRPGTKG